MIRQQYRTLNNEDEFENEKKKIDHSSENPIKIQL